MTTDIGDDTDDRQLILDSDLYLHITRAENRETALYANWNAIEERGIHLTAEIEAELAK